MRRTIEAIALVNGQHLLDLLPTLFCFDSLVPNGRPRSVPENPCLAFSRIARCVCLAFSRLLYLVKHAEDFPDHLAGVVAAEVLGNGHPPFHAGLAQYPDIGFSDELIAGEAGEGVDEDDVHGFFWRCCHVDHAEEFRTAIVRG